MSVDRTHFWLFMKMSFPLPFRWNGTFIVKLIKSFGAVMVMVVNCSLVVAG